MATGESASCFSSGSEQTSSSNPPQQNRLKLEIYNKVLQRVKHSDLASKDGFEDDLWAHFNRLPARYSIDFNLERADDVFTHMNLLRSAKESDQRPVFSVRVVQAPAANDGISEEVAGNLGNKRVHPPPMFGSMVTQEALGSEPTDSRYQDGDSISNGNLYAPRPMHEITFSSDDKPKLLSQLTSLLGELNLNILEAHAFSTNDGFSLDVFVVQGWHYEETKDLEEGLNKEIKKIRVPLSVKSHPLPSPLDQLENVDTSKGDHVPMSIDSSNSWEVDFHLLKFERLVASGAYGDLYKGRHFSQDVAIKVLKSERVTPDMQKEFLHEVYIMRNLRHKNIVKFLGACTKSPFICIITEFMFGGSLYDLLHKERKTFKPSTLLKIAIDISAGMSYLHQNSIIHRDLKTANLLMDENENVKVADFGVARVKIPSGIMTAETGTYRWMAPEVIEHKPYDHKADVFSFGIVLWELLTGQIPYGNCTPLQAAVGVVQKNLRPTIPKNTHPKLTKLLQTCWEQNPGERPDFEEILETLDTIKKEVKDVPEKVKGHGKFFHFGGR